MLNQHIELESESDRWKEIKKSDGTMFTGEEARRLSLGSSIYLPVQISKGEVNKPSQPVSIQPVNSIIIIPPLDPLKIRPVFDIYEEKIFSIRDSIKDVSRSQKVSSNLVGAIILDELKKRGLDDDLQDLIAANPLSRWILPDNISLGWAQMQIGLAKELLKKERDEVITILLDPTKAAELVARRVRQTMDRWKSNYPEIENLTNNSKGSTILGTLYSQGLGNPKSNPQSNTRGEEIALNMSRIGEIINASSLPPTNIV